MREDARPRVALVTSGFGPRLGGVGVVSAAMVEAFARDMKLTVWRHRPDWPAGLRSIALILRAWAGSFQRPDIIVFTHVDLARVMFALPILRRVPFAVMIHGVEVWQPLDRWRRASLERASAILANSDYTVRKARAANPWLPPVRVVWLGAEDRRTAVAARSTPLVLILGRMAKAERYKGHDALIDAWPRVLSAVPHARLVIAGDGDDRARLQSRSAGIESISFAGFVNDGERERLLRTAAVLVSISTGEGFGLAALEAAATGLPIVALKGEVNEELFPGGCGHLLLDTAEPPALADAVIVLLTDTARARAIGSAGTRRVREAFTIDHFHERLRAALQPALSAN